MPELDGIRGIAILLVLIWHYSLQAQLDPIATHIVAYAWSGVDLFFVLSGFLIGGWLIDNRARNGYFTAFYLRRVFRILPLYVAFVLLGFALLRLGSKPVETGELARIGWYATFTQNFWMTAHDNWGMWLGQTWSLAVEEQFYLVLPALVLIVRPRRLPLFMLGAVAVAFAVRLAMWIWLGGTPQATLATHILFPSRMDALALGVLVAWVLRQPTFATAARINVRRLYLALAVLAAALVALNVSGALIGTAAMQVAGLSLLAAFYAALLLLAIIDPGGPVAWVARSPVLRILGTWAYSIYLSHWLVAFYVFAAFGRPFAMKSPADWAIASVAIGATMFLAYLSWRFIEGPLIAIGHRLTHARHDSRDVAAKAARAVGREVEQV